MGNREHCLNLYIFFLRIKHPYNTKKIYIIAIKKKTFLVFKLTIARNNGVKFYLIFLNLPWYQLRENMNFKTNLF